MSETIAQRLKHLREKAGISQRDFAKSLDLAPSTYNFYETGRQIPRADVVIEVCKKYNVSANWLLGLPERDVKAPTWSYITRLVKMLVAGKTSLVLPAHFEADSVSRASFTDLSAIVGVGVSLVAIPNLYVFDYFKQLAMIENVTAVDGIIDAWEKGVHEMPPLAETALAKDWQALEKMLNDENLVLIISDDLKYKKKKPPVE